MKKKEYSKEEVANMKKIAKYLISLKHSKVKLNKYEYYMLGGISLRAAGSAIYYMINDRVINQLEYNVLHNYIDEQLMLGSTRNKEFILSTYYQFGNTIITSEEKLNIWNSLLSMGIAERDIDDLVFSAAVREYAKNNGLISNVKKKVYIPDNKNK